MENNRLKFTSLLKQLSLQNIEHFDSGSIDNIRIRKDSLLVDIYLSFNDVLNYKDAFILEEQIKLYFTKVFADFKTIVYFTYNNKTINVDSLEEYINAIVSLIYKSSSRISALNALTRNIEINNVKYYVANSNERESFVPLITMISREFKRYGLGFVKFELLINEFEMSISEEINNLDKMNTENIMSKESLLENELAINTKNQESAKGKKKPRMASPLSGTPTPLKEIPMTEFEVIEYKQKHEKCEFLISGDIIESEIREIKSFKLFTGTLTDGEDSIIIKTFINTQNPKIEDFYKTEICKGKNVKLFGEAVYDKFSRDVVFNIKDAMGFGSSMRSVITDEAKEKRVELHAHTKMSAQDAVMSIEEYVQTALDFGHRAIAVTDHFNVQSLPDLERLCKKANIKPIFGVEGNLVDEDGFKIALTDDSFLLKDKTYVIYDFETTGFSAVFHEIIEIGAVKVKNNLIIDSFSTFIKPKRSIPLEITKVTSITNDDVRNAPSIEEILPEFKQFIEGCCLVAHNATFDNSHLYENLKRLGIYDGKYPTIDTLQLARVRYSNKLKRFRLDSLAKFFNVDLSGHHRAVNDAQATAEIFLKMLHDLEQDGISCYEDINKVIDNEVAYKYSYPTHVTILVKNEEGKKNLNKIISDSHTVHFHQTPRILKSYLEEHREGLLIGSSCYNGDVFDTAYRKGYDELLEVIKFYDYLEVQPPEVYAHMVKPGGDPDTMSHIKKTIKRIIKAGNESGILVVATGDVHHLTREDLKFREIFIDAPQVGGGHHELYGSQIGSQHYRTTFEMLNDFSFLPEEEAFEIVVTNTNLVCDMIEEFPLFPPKLFAPTDDFMADRGIPSIKVELRNLCYRTAHEKYGEQISPYIIDRLEKELHSIITNEFSSNYYISHLLVKHSRDAGYVVGSRGSVGSSLTATFMKITEVNSLPPHYVCPKCHFTAIKLTKEEKQKYPQTKEALELDDVLQSVDAGFDLPERKCPICGEIMERDGFDIPFETFLGFNGDKVPDIDLNFSGDYQAKAHEFCRELFGYDHAFRAGTIGTIAEKTAYGYVKGWLERQNKTARNVEISRLAKKVEGVKRSTGQHPGGIVVVPRNMEYTDIIPVQYPADDTTSTWRTSHYDYHKFEANLLKLDILGHDDPTMIRHLMNFVEEFPDEFPFSKVEEIPLSDPDVLALFSGLSSLKITSQQIHNDIIATTGLPEFGTTLAKDMLREIKPTTVSDLVKISGLSHGTDVWNGNARDYMLGLKEGVKPIPFKDLIGCRDDIMVYLISKDVPANDAFKIMESVRKGKGVSSTQETIMNKYGVPKWYIDSCKTIKYMFPKAHAAAYVIMALRIGWFKVHRPIYYYAGFFSRRANAFNVTVMVDGWPSINQRINDLDEKIKNKSISTKESDEYSALLLALEMTARGFKFLPIDIKKSDYRDFLVSEDKKGLIMPFSSVDSLGENTAKSIVEARSVAPFTSKKDIIRRTKINSTVFEKMDQMGVFSDLPDEDQLGLF